MKSGLVVQVWFFEIAWYPLKNCLCVYYSYLAPVLSLVFPLTAKKPLTKTEYYVLDTIPYNSQGISKIEEKYFYNRII